MFRRIAIFPCRAIELETSSGDKAGGDKRRPHLIEVTGASTEFSLLLYSSLDARKEYKRLMSVRIIMPTKNNK